MCPCCACACFVSTTDVNVDSSFAAYDASDVVVACFST
jgi:hypothetical protein